jgi:hypothetical protein
MQHPTRAVISFVFGVMAIALVLVPAQHAPLAATLTNADRAAREITIIIGDARKSQTVAGGGVVEDLCPEGCIVRIDNDAGRDFVLEGRERVTIEDGLLYYDGELAPKPAEAAK